MKRRTGTDEHPAISVRTAAGTVCLSFSRKGITAIDLPRTAGGGVTVKSAARAESACLLSVGRKAAVLLRRYFSGKRVNFDLPVDLGRATEFQKAVWRAAAKIPYGKTRSYAWVAKKIGRPKAARAVGQALGANPVPVIIPCHRVISSAGTLGGFSGGLPMKRRLLAIEAGRPACAAADRRK